MKKLFHLIFFMFLFLNEKSYCEVCITNSLLFALAQQALKNQLEYNVDIVQPQLDNTQGSAQVLQNTQRIGVDVSLVCQNELGAAQAGCKSKPITKFEISGDYLGASGFSAQTGENPGIVSMNAGLDAILEGVSEINGFIGERTAILRNMLEKRKKVKKSRSVVKTVIIDEPGIYKISQDLTGGIIIDSDNVTIDLNGLIVLGYSRTAIIITSNKKNIKIMNGLIWGGKEFIVAPSGIHISKGCEDIEIKNIDISFCQIGVRFNGTKKENIKNCHMKNCTFDTNRTAITIHHTKNSEFHQCKLLNCLEKKIQEENSKNNIFKNCN